MVGHRGAHPGAYDRSALHQDKARVAGVQLVAGMFSAFEISHLHVPKESLAAVGYEVPQMGGEDGDSALVQYQSASRGCFSDAVLHKESLEMLR